MFRSTHWHDVLEEVRDRSGEVREVAGSVAGSGGSLDGRCDAEGGAQALGVGAEGVQACERRLSRGGDDAGGGEDGRGVDGGEPARAGADVFDVGLDEGVVERCQ